ncbi:MAG: efflux RND transporter periplasmic adaptor subunit [bacterium]|nr:efflux RND transporter periplasmic adaptor subunit [bacterium]
MKKWVIPIIIGLVVIVGIAYRISVVKGQENKKVEGVEAIQMREGFPVEVVPVQVGPFEVWREIPGKVEGYRQAVISTPVTARVASIRYQVGDEVKKDVPIINLDESDPKDFSRSKLLRSVYEDSRREYERYKVLSDSGGISANALEKVRLAMESAKTNLEQADANVQLSSPVSGTLMALYARVGERAERDKTIAVVSAVDQLRVVAAVSDHDVAELKPGQDVRLVTAPGKEHRGKVERVSLGANPDTGLFDLEIMLDNEERNLRIGTYVNVEVRIYSEKKAAAVDSRTRFRDSDGKECVFQAEGDIAHKVAVRVVAENDDNSSLEGLNPAWPVVLTGQSQLKDGVKLRIEKAEKISQTSPTGQTGRTE